jgi:hypothetical protein
MVKTVGFQYCIRLDRIELQNPQSFQCAKKSFGLAEFETHLYFFLERVTH